MSKALFRSIVNPGLRTPITGLNAAATRDSTIVMEATINVLTQGGAAVELP